LSHISSSYQVSPGQLHERIESVVAPLADDRRLASGIILQQAVGDIEADVCAQLKRSYRAVSTTQIANLEELGYHVIGSQNAVRMHHLDYLRENPLRLSLGFRSIAESDPFA